MRRPHERTLSARFFLSRVRCRCALRRFTLKTVLLFTVLFCPLSYGARRTPYGGQIDVYTFGHELNAHPSQTTHAAEVFLSTLLYETLFERSPQGHIVPILANEVPDVNGQRLTISLRQTRHHEGEVVSASDVAEALQQFLAPGSHSAHIVFPVVRRSDGRLDVRANDDAQTVSIGLKAVYPSFLNLLASPRAAIALHPKTPHENGPHPGTGPYRVISRRPRSTFTLGPFVGHWRGRPFLDRINLSPLASRFAVQSKVKDQKAALVFGVPDSASSAPRPIAGVSGEPMAKELLLLSVGNHLPSLHEAKHLDRIANSMRRQRLVDRYLGKNAQATTTLSGGPTDEHETSGTPTTHLQATLLIPKDLFAKRRFVGRIQLDLRRAGISAVVKSISRQTLKKRKRDGAYELMLDSVFPEFVDTKSPFDRLHTLLFVATLYGRPEALSLTRFAAFASAPDDQRAEMLRLLDRELRHQLRLIPLAKRTPSIAFGGFLRGIKRHQSGLPRVDDAYLLPEAAPPE